MHAKGMDQTMIDTAVATGTAGHDVAEILGRAHRHAVPPGGHSRYGAAASGARGYRADEVAPARAVSRGTAMAICCGRTASGAWCIASGRARSACCCGATL